MAGGDVSGPRPRVLVTGFSVFPGAPVNPTEALVAAFRHAPPAVAGMGVFRAECLAVDYAGLAGSLGRIGDDFSPDIAIHFGLAQTCRGFRMERLARNSYAEARPDNLGALPIGATICAGPETIASTLPLDQIAEALHAARLPVEWSDDAGGYLCNAVFTLSVAHACEGFRPAMSGFVHVPLLQDGAPPAGSAMTMDDLAAGARIIVETCCAAWNSRPSQLAGPNRWR